MAAMEVSDSRLKKKKQRTLSNGIVIYILPYRIQNTKLKLLKKSARDNRYNIKDDLCEEVTHILTALQTMEQVVHFFDKYEKESNARILSTKWLKDSIVEKAPITEDGRLSKYAIRNKAVVFKPEVVSDVINTHFKGCSNYICRRKYLLNHQNLDFVAALKVFARCHKYRADAKNPDCQEEFKAWTYRIDVAIIKNLPFKVNHLYEINYIPYIRFYSNKIIRDFLQSGKSVDVQAVKDNEWFKTMELFTGIYGIDLAAAKELHDSGYRTVDDLCDVSEITPLLSDIKIICGLGFYEDLKSITRDEADQIHAILQKEVDILLPGVRVVLSSSLRRGKEEARSSCFLISHPKPTASKAFLSDIHDRLLDQNIILYSRIFQREEKENETCDIEHDSYEKCVMLLRCPTDGRKWSEVKDCDQNFKLKKFDEIYKISKKRRQWKAVRVELLVFPASYFAYALISFTGSSCFIGCLRNYSECNCNMTLYYNRLFDNTRNIFLPAVDERDIFAHLKLDYVEPWERNA